MLPPRHGPPAFPRGYQDQDQDPDAPIRETDNDAALARLSAVQKHYVADPYIAALVPRAHLHKPRPPLINIGTYLRGTAIDALVEQWIRLASAESANGPGKGDGKVQIVSLGAGSDTRFWRLATGPHKDLLARYVELDFPEITSKKAMAIRKSKVLNPLLGPSESVKVGNGGTSLHAPVYNLLPVDMRKPPSETLAPILAGSPDPLLLPNVPTLLLFECVLAYMSPAASDALIRWFAEYVLQGGAGSVGSIVYEMFGLGDAFGRVMLSNLKSRNVSLPGVEPYTDRASLPQRFLRLGFTAADALTLHEIRRDYVAPEELERISTLEFLDELEELDLVLDHYAITWGCKAPSGGAQERWKTWGLTRKAKKPEED
ncbi:leucine carboxyl methyltransferase [Dentipellis sp. KUC8613]|nr:leucine carboxyl methyltransferase [Dentipellis sp. KUC8613]